MPDNKLNIAIWVILGVVLLALASYILYQFIKDKIAKKKQRQAHFEFTQEAIVYVYELNVMVNKLIKLNKVKHDEFVPSIGEYTMSEINNNTRNILVKVFKSPEFREFLFKNPAHEIFIKNLEQLRDCNSNLWAKKIPNVLEYFNTNQVKAFAEVKKYNEASINQIYKEEAELHSKMEEIFKNEFNKGKEN
ncbi:MHJ_0274 family protein [Mycoplasma sp. 2248]|uniref:MHJ_0274 family protein n=1 Tax=Mycoplasma sp. 2248 TaxID=3108528 RepID=UPI002B1E1859|nr:hypothetical protein [Mycoplasma sp. 2248]MEA4190899.1 hypothetical protein [Mycoplasma sp. 2248]